MRPRKAALLAMVKMALVDGTVSIEERRMLEPLLEPGESLPQLMDEARSTKLHELAAAIERYADRFFVALRAASMANVDAHLDAREETLYDELVELLGIEKRDRELIERSVAALDSPNTAPPEPRLEELYQQ